MMLTEWQLVAVVAAILSSRGGLINKVGLVQDAMSIVDEAQKRVAVRQEAQKAVESMRVRG